MGVDARIDVFAKDQTSAETACSAAFERIAQLDTIMSDYRVNSELNLLCTKAGGPPVHISDDLYKIFDYSERISRESGGLFDITCSPIVRLWRQARKTHVMPTAQELKAARKVVGYRFLKLDPRRHTARLLKRGMQLDLGAIGKGYAGDEAIKVLKKHGIASALVEMGGDTVLSGPPPNQPGWVVEIPNKPAPSKYAPGINFLSNCAISSSGDTEQNVVIDGKKYSHVVNPLTGMALTDGVQATVIGPSGTETDGCSTALTLLPPARRKAFLRKHPKLKVYVKLIPYGEK